MKRIDYSWTTNKYEDFTTDLHVFPPHYTINGIVYKETDIHLYIPPKDGEKGKKVHIELRVPHYIVLVIDGNKYLYDNNGNLLYDVQGFSDKQVYNNCCERVYVKHPQVWKVSPKTWDKNQVTMDWGYDCVHHFGGSLVLYMKNYPKRSYTDCISMMTNEGYSIDEQGFVTKR